MCLVVDPGCIPKVFSTSNTEHKKFKPVLNWLMNGKGKFIYGGSLYRKELAMLTQYYKYLIEIQRRGNLIELDSAKVDSEEKKILKKKKSKKLNDPHLIALVIVSKCRIICSCDKTAYQFFGDKRFYPKKFKKPKIFNGNIRNKALLCDEYIIGICKK